MSDDFELCIARISQCELSDHQLAIVNNLGLLISVRGGQARQIQGGGLQRASQDSTKGGLQFFSLFTG